MFLFVARAWLTEKIMFGKIFITQLRNCVMLVTPMIDIVINTLLGRLTLDPASMHSPAWAAAFVSSSVFF